MIKLTVDDRQLKAGIKKLDAMVKNAPRQMAKSVNAALDIIKPEAEAAIVSRYNISDVDLKINKATAGNLAKGSLEGTGGMKPAEEFSPMIEDSGRFQRVSIEVIRGKRSVIKAGFIGNGRIMERLEDSQYPIHPVSRIGIPQMLWYHGISIPMAERLGMETMNNVEKTLIQL